MSNRDAKRVDFELESYETYNPNYFVKSVPNPLSTWNFVHMVPDPIVIEGLGLDPKIVPNFSFYFFFNFFFLK